MPEKLKKQPTAEPELELDLASELNPDSVKLGSDGELLNDLDSIVQPTEIESLLAKLHHFPTEHSQALWAEFRQESILYAELRGLNDKHNRYIARQLLGLISIASFRRAEVDFELSALIWSIIVLMPFLCSPSPNPEAPLPDYFVSRLIVPALLFIISNLSYPYFGFRSSKAQELGMAVGESNEVDEHVFLKKLAASEEKVIDLLTLLCREAGEYRSIGEPINFIRNFGEKALELDKNSVKQAAEEAKKQLDEEQARQKKEEARRLEQIEQAKYERRLNQLRNQITKKD